MKTKIENLNEINEQIDKVTYPETERTWVDCENLRRFYGPVKEHVRRDAVRSLGLGERL